MIKLTTHLRALAIAALVGVGSVAANAASLYLRSSGAADQAIELGMIRQIQFGDAAVTINLTDGSNVQVALSDFRSLRTTTSGTPGESAVSDIFVAAADQWNVYDLKGNLVGKASDIVGESGATLQSQLTPGIYIVKSQSQTLKVVVP